MEESAALVMRLATLVFSSPIAIWKLQNEFLRAGRRARCGGGACGRERLSPNVDASRRALFVLCASIRRACDGPLSG
jgi:hypothetical protein